MTHHTHNSVTQQHDNFEQWYAARVATVNKGGVVDAMLTLPMVKRYLWEAYEAGYEDADVWHHTLHMLKGETERR